MGGARTEVLLCKTQKSKRSKNILYAGKLQIQKLYFLLLIMVNNHNKSKFSWVIITEKYTTDMNWIKYAKYGNEKEITKNLNLKNSNLITFSADISILESSGSMLGLRGIHSLRQMSHAHSGCPVFAASPACPHNLCMKKSHFSMKMWGTVSDL